MQLNIRGHLKEFSSPIVMGVVNLTCDSFFAGSRTNRSELLQKVRAMAEAGATIIDLGACSTRPGSRPVPEIEESRRIVDAVKIIRSQYSDIIISVDTYRAEVAVKGIEAGADIINDISGGDLDPDMFETVAMLKVPYILGHTRGKPENMDQLTDYEDVASEVLSNLAFKADKLHQLGVCDVIIDPGFGFAKNLDQNYKLLAYLDAFHETGCPVLAGLSRKSMIYKELGCTPEEALNGTTALNMIALLNGADILRVHDVKEATDTIKLFEAYRRNLPGRHLIASVDARGKRKFTLI